MPTLRNVVKRLKVVGVNRSEKNKQKMIRGDDALIKYV